MKDLLPCNEQKSMAGKVIGPKEEPTTIALLNGYTIKLPSQY